MLNINKEKSDICQSMLTAYSKAPSRNWNFSLGCRNAYCKWMSENLRKVSLPKRTIFLQMPEKDEIFITEIILISPIGRRYRKPFNARIIHNCFFILMIFFSSIYRRNFLSYITGSSVTIGATNFCTFSFFYY